MYKIEHNRDYTTLTYNNMIIMSFMNSYEVYIGDKLQVSIKGDFKDAELFMKSYIRDSKIQDISTVSLRIYPLNG